MASSDWRSHAFRPSDATHVRSRDEDVLAFLRSAPGPGPDAPSPAVRRSPYPGSAARYTSSRPTTGPGAEFGSNPAMPLSPAIAGSALGNCVGRDLSFSPASWEAVAPSLKALTIGLEETRRQLNTVSRAVGSMPRSSTLNALAEPGRSFDAIMRTAAATHAAVDVSISRDQSGSGLSPVSSSGSLPQQQHHHLLLPQSAQKLRSFDEQLTAIRTTASAARTPPRSPAAGLAAAPRAAPSSSGARSSAAPGIHYDTAAAATSSNTPLHDLMRLQESTINSGSALLAQINQRQCAAAAAAPAFHAHPHSLASAAAALAVPASSADLFPPPAGGRTYGGITAGHVSRLSRSRRTSATSGDSLLAGQQDLLLAGYSAAQGGVAALQQAAPRVDEVMLAQMMQQEEAAGKARREEERLRKEVARLQEELHLKQQQLRAAEADRAQGLAQRDGRLGQLEAELAAAREQLAARGRDCEELATQAERLSAERVHATTQLREARESADASAAELQEARKLQEVSAQRQEQAAADAKALTRGLWLVLQRLQHAVGQRVDELLPDDIASAGPWLERHFGDAVEGAQGVVAELAAARKEVESKARLVQSLSSQVAEVKEQAGAVRKQLDAAREQLAARDRQIDSLRDRVEDLTVQHNQLLMRSTGRDATPSLQAELDRLSNANSSLVDRLQEARTRAEDKAQLAEAVSAELATARRAVDEKGRLLDAAAADAATLRGELIKLQAALSDREAQLEQSRRMTESIIADKQSLASLISSNAAAAAAAVTEPAQQNHHHHHHHSNSNPMRSSDAGSAAGAVTASSTWGTEEEQPQAQTLAPSTAAQLQVAAYAERCAQLQKRVNELEERIAVQMATDVQGAAAPPSEEDVAAAVALAKRNRELKDEVSSLHYTLNAVRQQLAAERDAAQEQLAAAQKQVASLQVELAQGQALYLRDCSESSTTIDDLQRTLAVESERWQLERARLVEELQALQAELDAKCGQVAELEGQLELATGDLDHVRGCMQNYEEVITSLEEELNHKKVDLQALGGKAAKLETELDSARSSLKELNIRYAALTGPDGPGQRLQAATAALEELRGKHEALAQALQAARAESAGLSEQLVKLEEENLYLSGQKQVLQDEIDSLQREQPGRQLGY